MGRRDDLGFMGITDVKLDNAVADSYKYIPIAALLAQWETIKKDKNSKHCNNKQEQFSLFFFQYMRC